MVAVIGDDDHPAARTMRIAVPTAASIAPAKTYIGVFPFIT
jgi:hypothetical protein